MTRKKSPPRGIGGILLAQEPIQTGRRELANLPGTKTPATLLVVREWPAYARALVPSFAEVSQRLGSLKTKGEHSIGLGNLWFSKDAVRLITKSKPAKSPVLWARHAMPGCDVAVAVCGGEVFALLAPVAAGEYADRDLYSTEATR